ncbi:hypothetical protein IC619_011790 [Hazenella sp. IB182353]|uniref:hypothetical protein n=1 Tax=Polycladospora coralii TaxID=2771432 RepID=UPI00174692E4|nr:hypothetical protein [Polycladospora coralii]MBS7531178.1 hypothetical protein [Polycladospora coralii]
MRDTIPKEILLKPDKSRFGEIIRKGYYKEAGYVNELVKTSRMAKFGWINKEIITNSINRFKFGLNNEADLLSNFG